MKLRFPFRVYCDNQSAKAIAETSLNTARSKWYDVKCKFLSDYTQKKKLFYHYVPSADNVSDILTKSLTSPGHRRLLLQLLGYELPSFLMDTESKAFCLSPKYEPRSVFDFPSEYAFVHVGKLGSDALPGSCVTVQY